MFQSTHPRGVRRHQQQRGPSGAPVSIHAPAWGATGTITLQKVIPEWFQSTHPRGVRPRRCTAPRRCRRSFNPRTRVGCDMSTEPESPETRVSIHAPAWGATLEGVTVTCDNDEFQSTHPRGVRPVPPSSARRWRACFNPRTRVGCDCRRGAPAKAMAGFNPRTRVGCDGCAVWSTGCRPQSFNPRTRVGCDVSRGSKMAYINVSIHAPAWGATERPSSPRPSAACFNPRTRVGCDSFRQIGGWVIMGFNPRTRVGCDGGRCSIILYAAMFQSTHPRGVRPDAAVQSPPGRFCFNPRTRVGCDSSRAMSVGALAMFQSTHPRGVRQGELLHLAVMLPVSIHAPAWGATPCRLLVFLPRNSFNPRTRVGCDCFHVLSSRFP